MKKETKKIKLMTTEQKEVELEITFPYFTKSDGFYCCFLSMEKVIWVVDYSFVKQIEFSSGTVPETWITNEPITKEKFYAKFNEVLNVLINLKGDIL
jgi:hypothetical protein